MLGYADNIRFFLFSNEEGKVRIPPYKGYNAGNGDVIERNKEGKYFEIKKGAKLEMFREAYEYLRKINVLYGINPDVRLLVDVKDDMSISEDWKTITNVGIDLMSLDFDDTQQIVKAEIITGGLIGLLEKRWDDEYDVITNDTITGNTLSNIKTVQVRLEPRQILKRSRLFIDDGTVVVAQDDTGKTGKALPFLIDYKSEAHIVQVVSQNMNSAGGDWTDLAFSGSAFILNCPADTTYKLNGKVKTRITAAKEGTFDLDMVFFENGANLEYKGKVHLDDCDPNVVGNICEYTFTDYELTVLAGETVSIGTLSEVTELFENTIEYEILETSLILETEDLYPQTYTKAMKPLDMVDRLVGKITGDEGRFISTVFGAGGKYENVLIAHGTWLRGMPEVINEGEDDERRVQAAISLKQFFTGYSILEPLRYGASPVGLTEFLSIGTEKETQLNKVGVRIGETRDKFQLTQVQKVTREVIGDNFFGKINIGSTTTGSEYGEVNNLKSICGNATWNTINYRSDSVYEALTEFRTGSEDIELQRQKQYSENPDQDAEYDDSWFLLDCKPSGGEYHLKKWDDYYETIPTKVYSAATNYNWIFTPARLLLGHGWKIKSAIDKAKYINESLKFISSNCHSSLITKKVGQIAIGEDQPIPHNIIDSATINNMTVIFNNPVNQEIIEQLRDVDNLNGLVEFKTQDGVEYGRLIKVDTNNNGKWTLVEAKLN